MEQTAEQERQERREAAVKLLRILESSPLDEALLLSCSMIAVILRSAKVEVGSDQWWDFFVGVRAHVAELIETLDVTPSVSVH